MSSEAPSKVTIAATLLDSGSVNNQSSQATASVSPTANALVVLAVLNQDVPATAPTVNSATSAGLTFDSIGTVNAGGFRSTLMIAQDASPGTGAITIDFAADSQSAIGWVLFELTDVVVGNNGADAIVQTVTSTTESVTLAAFEGGSASIACFSKDDASAFTAVSGAIIAQEASGGGFRSAVAGVWGVGVTVPEISNAGGGATNRSVAAEVRQLENPNMSSHSATYIPQSSHAAGIT